MNTPILFLIFNRPDKTQKVFDVIRQVKPAQLFIAADGPRLDRPSDIHLCEETRKIITQIDWECDVQTLLRSENLGCKKAVQGALDWFFDHVEEGIILEDDCVPNISFFTYCSELLERYRDNTDIFLISGRNNNPLDTTYKYDYFFSKFAHIWGWATWKRSWQLYDRDMQLLTPEFEQYLTSIIQNKKGVENTVKLFHKTKRGEVNTWDYQLSLTALALKKYSIIPKYNLIKNIGFDASATHTKLSNLTEHIQVHSIDTSLVHPLKIELNSRLEQSEADRLHIPLYKKIINLSIALFKKLMHFK
jgi:hypothetical protein